jgi:hypothetical protein
MIVYIALFLVVKNKNKNKNSGHKEFQEFLTVKDHSILIIKD